MESIHFFSLYKFLGDISKQREIRDNLKCKSFDWYMKNVAFDQDYYYPFVEPTASAEG